MMNNQRTVELAALRRWATEHGAVLDLEGECGFGRECVGISVGHQWLDYAAEPSLAPPPSVAPNAYHKHECLAVLGRGDGAIHQLFEWVMFIEESGGVVVQYRQPDPHDLAALLGRTIPAMCRPSSARTAPPR
jgi:hypothetical protein